MGILHSHLLLMDSTPVEMRYLREAALVSLETNAFEESTFSCGTLSDSEEEWPRGEIYRCRRFPSPLPAYPAPKQTCGVDPAPDSQRDPN